MKNENTILSMKQMQKNSAKAELLLKQLANANRLLVLCHLITGEKSVGELAVYIGLSPSALSQHLSKMRESGIVECDKRGLEVYYRICSMEAQAILSVLHLIYCKDT